MGKAALKLNSPGDGISKDSEKKKKKSPSSRAKERPRKSLMRQHRRQSLEAEMSEQPHSPQAESPLLKPEEENPPRNSDKPSLRTSGSRLTSLKWPRRRAKEHNNAEHASAETNQNEQSPTSARRSSIMSWRSRNSTASIVEDAAPASCPLSCQPSSCFIGSLNGSISETHLPLLTKQTKARLNALKAAPKQRQLEVTIEHTGELPFGAYSHPQVRVHIVDRCTGRALCPAQMTNESKCYTESSNYTNAFEWHQALAISVDMLTLLSTRTVLLFEILETKPPRKGRRFRRGNRFESVSTHDEEDEYRHSLGFTSQPEYRRIAWGFFHTITNKGTPTMDSFVLPYVPDANGSQKTKQPSIIDVCGLCVRLFGYQVVTWMDSYQAKLQWGWRKNHPTVPAVFLQYQKRSRAPAPSTLQVQLKANFPVISPRQTAIPETTEVTAGSDCITSDELETSKKPGIDGARDNLEPPAEVSPQPNASETGSKIPPPTIHPSEQFDLVAPCKRNTSEPCLIPQRVMCSLPSGKKGCSAVSFSPCGRYLAASVSPELGEFVVRVYQLSTAELFAVGRGHRGVIYSLEWTVNPNGQLRILSASSDGTVRQWELPSPASSTRARLLLLVFQWHHFPSFVYCAIFLPGSNGDIVLTGASDGGMRFRKESSVPNGQPEYGTVRVSSVAVHSICVDPKSGRVFCGDATGDVTVWTRASSTSSIYDYELIKTIQTGQSCITNLQLHPRKAHLLVHTQPNAIFQYELRSYLLLNKSYAGVACESLLVKSTFSPDGKLVISGSEDGIPRLFTSLHGQELQRGVWGTHFFHGCPVLDVSWSPTAHMAALCSYGGDNPIVVLCSYRDDKDATFFDESAANTLTSLKDLTANLQQFAVAAFRGTNQLDAVSGDHAQRLQRALERRRQRLQAKISLETQTSEPASAAV